MGAMTSIGATVAVANPVLGLGMMAAGALLGGIFGQGKANQLADIQSQAAGVQNQIYAEQFGVQKANMLQQRRQMFRQGQVASAGATVAAASSGSFRGSGFGAVQDQIATTTQENMGQIDSSIATGARITALNQQQASLQAQGAKVQAKSSFLDSIF